MSRSNNSRKGSFTSHRKGKGMGHKVNGKYSVGIGGINCSCCTKGKTHKEEQRKWERHTDNHNLHNELQKEE